MDARRGRPRRPGATAGGLVRLALAAVVVVTLSGCFSVLHAAQRAVAPEDMRGIDASQTAPPTTSLPAPATSVLPAAPQVSIAPDTVAAVAAIRSPGRAFYGRLSVVATITGGFEVRITGYRPPQGRNLVAVVSAKEISSDSTCDRTAETDDSLPPLGSLGHKSSITFTLAAASNEFRRNDPTFLTNIVFLDPSKSSPGCLAAIGANARLVWNLPDMNPGFRVLDTGQALGADGQTDGNFQQLISYSVVDGDLLSSIARRFSITTADLEWLNPTRTGGLGAQPGEILNLARYLR